jgi:RNA polymerase sigma-70 factor (ECF subfamily)
MPGQGDRGKTEARRQKEAKLASLYNECYDKIARYAFLRIGDRMEAEDLSGEVFLKALQSLESYEERDVPMQAWLFTIARNLVVDHLRKASKHRSVPIDTLQLEGGVDPATLVEGKIERERVSKAMEELTAEQREVLGLRFFSGLTSKEAGSVLKKSDGAVREMQRAAIEKLRKLLATDYSSSP